MKITVLQENLKQILGYLQKVIPSKPQLPILSSILLKVENEKLILSATDLYLGIRSELVANVESEGSIVVSGDIFKSLILSLAPGKIELEQSDNLLLIKQGRTRTKLAIQNADEYPQFPKVEGDEFDLKINDLEKIQTLVSFAAGTDQTRPVLTSLLMKFSPNGLEVVSTDGFRLARLFFSDLKFAFEKELLVPVKALNEVYRIAKQIEAEDIKISVSDELKQLLFKVANVEVFVRLIEGDYPPYQKIIPPSFATEIKFDAEEFLTELKRAQVFAREASNIVKLTLKKKDSGLIIQIHSQSPSFGEYLGEMSVELETGMFNEDDELPIAFNVFYLIDFINAVKPERIYLGMNESLKPALLRDENAKNYLYIAMPFRVND